MKYIYLKNQKRFDLIKTMEESTEYQIQGEIIEIIRKSKEIKGKKINYLRYEWNGYYNIYYWGNLSIQLIVSEIRLKKNGQPFDKYNKDWKIYRRIYYGRTCH